MYFLSLCVVFVWMLTFVLRSLELLSLEFGLLCNNSALCQSFANKSNCHKAYEPLLTATLTFKVVTQSIQLFFKNLTMCNINCLLNFYDLVSKCWAVKVHDSLEIWRKEVFNLSVQFLACLWKMAKVKHFIRILVSVALCYMTLWYCFQPVNGEATTAWIKKAHNACFAGNSHFKTKKG